MMHILAKYRIPCLAASLLFFFLFGCGEDRPTRPLYFFSVSGAVTALAPSRIDGDTNNPAQNLVSNDSSARAQQLELPVSLGGYVTAEPTGVSGDRFATSADEQDWYRLVLSAGQTISLQIADHDGNATNLDNPDIDLFLFDSGLSAMQSSESKAQTEVIAVQVAGDYFLQVKAITGGSNYRLTTSDASVASLPAAARIEQAFVPGELIVKFRPQVSTAAAGQGSATLVHRAEDLGLKLRAGGAGASALFQLDSGQTQAGIRLAAAADSAETLLQAKRATLDELKRLQREPDVLSVDLNYLRRPLLVPNDELYPSQWNLAQINLPQAWEQAAAVSDAVIAVVDTGVLFDHPDLAGRLCLASDDCAGYDFVADVTNSDDGDGIDPDPQDPGDNSLTGGLSFFHGTHVAGIIGALANNGQGIAGIDWQSKIMPVRVFGRNGATSWDIMQGVSYAAGLANDSATLPPRHANIINLSLGGEGFSQAEQELFTQVRAAGVFLVASAGNDGSTAVVYPAGYPGVLSVSAVDFNKNRASYSNRGATIDLAAPGGDTTTNLNADDYPDGVLSTSGNDLTSPVTYNYDVYAGTSMAAPHVSGVIGLMLAADPALTPADFDVLLAAGLLTEDSGNDGATIRNDDFGYGLIDANQALLTAFDHAGNPVLPAVLFFSPRVLDFGTTSQTQNLTLTNAGSGNLTLTGISFTEPWISAVTLGNETPVASGLGDYLVEIDRSGLAAGSYTAEITFETDVAGSYTLAIKMQVAAPVVVGDIGPQTIALLDAQTEVPRYRLQVSFDPASSNYPYHFPVVEGGFYLLVASSDLDNDGQLCDAGEACGRYPLIGSPVAVEVIDQNLEGLDFSSTFE